jgi:PhnB protein
MKTMSPWINFNGNAEGAFNFYQSILGGEFTKVVRFRDIASDEFPVDETDADKIMQITLTFGPSNSLIGNDVPEFMGTVNESENRSKIYISTESKEEAERIFRGLSDGGAVEVPFDDSAEEVFTMFRDAFGVEWIVAYSPSE